MKLPLLAALAPAALALAACGQEQQATDGNMSVDETEDALSGDTSVLPPQDTSGQVPPAAATPTPEATMTAPVEPLPETDPDIRT